MPEHFFSTDLGSCGIGWHESKLIRFHLPNSGVKPTNAPSPPSWLQPSIDRIQAHARGELHDFSDLRYAFETVTDFQREVYLLTLAIKPGLTRSYGELAKSLRLPPGGSRAVAAALGANPWPLLIPCHRVIGSTGKLTGFSGPGGIATKVRLLALEGAQLL